MSLPKDIVPDRNEALRRQQADPLVASVARAAEGAGLSDCPEAESLALYAEGQLGPDERGIVMPHLQTCDRCQAIVAAYERASADAPERMGRQAAPQAPDDAPGRGPLGWFAGWRWLVPAASLAGAVAVAMWVGRAPAPDTDMARTAPATETAFAPGQPVDPPRQAPAATAPAAALSEQRPGISGDTPGPGRRAGANPEAASRPLAPPAGAAAAAEPTPPAAPAPAAVADARARTLEAARAEEAAPPAATTFVAASPVVAAEPGAPPEPGATAGATMAANQAARRPEAPGTPADASTVPPAAAPGARAAKMAQAPTWRVRNGQLERTTDGGRTWRRVTPPFADGVASVMERPDGSVVVTSAAGARAVTTDGGATWRRM